MDLGISIVQTPNLSKELPRNYGDFLEIGCSGKVRAHSRGFHLIKKIDLGSISSVQEVSNPFTN
jgi:hypothetical protein